MVTVVIDENLDLSSNSPPAPRPESPGAVGRSHQGGGCSSSRVLCLCLWRRGWGGQVRLDEPVGDAKTMNPQETFAMAAPGAVTPLLLLLLLMMMLLFLTWKRTEHQHIPGERVGSNLGLFFWNIIKKKYELQL